MFNASENDRIGFDEIFFNHVKNIDGIHNYVEHNLDTIIIATGDTQQLKPIEDRTNQFDCKTYLSYYADQRSTHQIFLQDTNRIKAPNQKALAMNIFDEPLTCKSQESREKLIRKHVQVINIAKNENNIMYVARNS